MARVTVEDCIRKVPNRFYLVRIAAIRTKQLKRGAAPLVEREENREAVIALREIAAGSVRPDYYPAEESQPGGGDAPAERSSAPRPTITRARVALAGARPAGSTST